jgi:hypothetical protein
MALRTIRAGEEILVNYNGDPKSREKVEFDVIENGEHDVLADGKPADAANGHMNGSSGKKRPSASRKKRK